MKPTFATKVSNLRRNSSECRAAKRHSLPVTDYNYHALAIDGPQAGYARASARSFWNMAADYFKTEARRDFRSEAALFAIIAVTGFLSLISGVHALIEFARATGSF